MSRFILIDNSLEAVGGHHYQFARDVLEAAASRGMEGALVTHRRFWRYNDLPSDWTVLPLFRYNGYSRHAICLGGGVDGPVDEEGRPLAESNAQAAEGAADSWWRRWPLRWGRANRERERARYLRAYELTLSLAFRKLGIFHDDVIFLATASDLDVLGLVRYLRSDPRTKIPCWQLQFHFDLMEGREDEHAQQAERLSTVRRQLTRALSLAPQHRFRFYCTTEALARQYRQTGIGPVQELAYPANPRMVVREAAVNPADRLRVTCAGALRREKGKGAFQRLVERLDAHPVAPRLQLSVQFGRKSRWLRRRQDALLQINVARHPLSTEQYARLVRDSDVGLFLYDRRRYAARCSGVLVEMLSAGIPVVVPAACWLSDQLDGAQALWMDRLFKRHRSLPATTIEPPYDACQADWPADAAQALVEIESEQPFPPGVHALLAASAGASDEPGAKSLFRCTGGPARLLVDRAPDESALRLRVQSALDQPLPPLKRLRVRFLPVREPLGVVGLCAADADQIPRLLAEMAEHYPHYRRSAEAFAEGWRQQHAPRRVVDLLVDDAQATRQTTPRAA